MRKSAKLTGRSAFPTAAKLGIVGGGQLARMLALEALPMGVSVHILCPDRNEPAAQVTAHWHEGSPEHPHQLQKFAQEMDFLTFESEFFDLAPLKSIKKTQIAPSPEAMSLLQNRFTQKAALKQWKVPTSPFVFVDDLQNLEDVRQQLGGKIVLKLANGGYDGKGTFYSKNSADSKKLQTQMAQSSPSLLAEAFIPFQRELALMCARSTRGEFIHFPLVQSHQVESRCDWVMGPIQHPALARLLPKLKKFLAGIDYVGVIGFELFDVNGDLLVNEVAPRVHNSGHYSQQALSESQFALHAKAVLGLPLHTPRLLQPAFCMVNLIGQGHKNINLDSNLTGTLHWYGKSESRKGRKMGHINYTGTHLRKLLQQALKERKRMVL